MFGLGTIINTAAIILGGLFGWIFGKLLNERIENALTTVCGISVIFIGVSGALKYMLNSETSVKEGGALLIIASLILGALIGEIIDFEGKFEKFGAWLKMKSGNAKDVNFITAFVNASFTVCIGAMAIVGAFEDALNGDISILVAKSILDFIIIVVMTASMGKGASFSAIPVFIIQGFFTVFAFIINPILTDAALDYISMIGSILIFCVGLNLVFGKKVKVANLIPSLIIAALAAYLPITF